MSRTRGRICKGHRCVKSRGRYHNTGCLIYISCLVGLVLGLAALLTGCEVKPFSNIVPQKIEGNIQAKDYKLGLGSVCWEGKLFLTGDGSYINGLTQIIGLDGKPESCEKEKRNHEMD